MSEDEILTAKKKAMSLLQYNDRTEWELSDKLSKCGFSKKSIKEAIEYVKSFHYIDDERYAIRFVEIYHETRSIKRLRQDLYKKHISDKLIEAALENINYDDTASLNHELERIKKPIYDMSYDEKQKLTAKLYRKGFNINDIMEKIKEFD